MKISSILFIDNNKKAKALITKYLNEILEQPKIEFCCKKQKLHSLLEKENFELVLINNELNWEIVTDLLDFLSKKYPQIGRMIFSDKKAKDLDKIIVLADAILSDYKNNLHHLSNLIEFAITRASERQMIFSLQKEYKELYDNVPIGLYKTDYTGKILTCNSAFIALLGYDSQEEMKNKRIQDYYCEKEYFSDSLRKYSTKSPYKRGRLQLRRKTGEKIWVEVDTKATYSEDMILLALHGSVKDITEQVNLENELKNSYENMELYLDSTDIYFIVLDKDEKIILANEKLAALYGMDKEDIIGENWFDILTKDPNARIAASKFYQDTLAGSIDENKFQENSMKMLDGSEKTLMWKSNVLRNDKNEIIAVIGSGSDITERKIVQQLLKENEEKYRKLVETSPDAILMTDTTGKISFANQQFIVIHGYSSIDEIIGKNLSSFIITKSVDRSFKRINLKQFVKESGFSELTMIRRDGTTFPAEVRGVFLLDEQGEPSGLIVVSHDISARKNAEIDLQNSERLYRTIFENTGTNMVVVDYKQRIVICNSQFEKFVDLPKEEIVGKSWKSLVHPNDYDYLAEIINDILISPESFPREIEFRVIGLEGYTRIVWAIIEVIPNTLTAILSIHDITERTMMDEIKIVMFDQIERNLEQFAILVDKIRNPLAVITGIVDITEGSLTSEIINQTTLIDSIITELDQRWLESINVREFLREHL